ncbi:hypothetical protein KBW81_03570 [Loktanella salsilacus]|uniref:hypothetical protein n=1 Tax=Loktanella salsilacus TaxID=195913 RepID=UPI0020B7601C|nr:hypothetical protein [Loktanella salsilacus]UTH48892.1 hypothetical protein KBW81_03570 [Loktanella salsilacus]
MAGLVKLRRSALQYREGLVWAVRVAAQLPGNMGGLRTFAARAKSKGQLEES